MRRVRTAFVAATMLVALVLGGPAPAAPPSLRGEVQYETFGYTGAGAKVSRWENFFATTIRGSGRVLPALSYEFEARGVADDAGFTAGMASPRNEASRRPYLSLATAVLHLRPVEGLRISAGRQLVRWSIIDELTPADVMNAPDLSDVLRRVDRGVDGVSVSLRREPFGAELVVVPLAFAPARLPQGRWDLVAGEALRRQEMPPVRFDETQAGLRIGYQAGALEASLFGYVGRDFYPVLIPKVIFVGGDDVFDVEIVARSPRLRAGGVSASHPCGENALLRAEIVHFASPDPERADVLYSTLGAEYSVASWRLVLNYIRQDVTARAGEEVTDVGPRLYFRSFAFGEARYDSGRSLLARLRGGYDFTGKFALLQPEISYRVLDDVELALVADAVHGVGASYFARIRQEDRVGLRARCYF